MDWYNQHCFANRTCIIRVLLLARIIFKRTKRHIATTMTRRLGEIFVKNGHFPSIKGKQKYIAICISACFFSFTRAGAPWLEP
jgi:hypothetical protein